MTTLPDKTAPAIPGPNPQIRLVVLDIVLLILFVATLLPCLHCLAGVFLLAGCGVHVALHGRWIRAVILDMHKTSRLPFIANGCFSGASCFPVFFAG